MQSINASIHDLSAINFQLHNVGLISVNRPIKLFREAKSMSDNPSTLI